MGTSLVECPDAADQPGPDRVDRFAAPRTGPAGPGRAHRATPGAARRRSCWPPPTGSRTRGSRRRWVSARTPSASGGTAGARHPGWRRWATRNGRGRPTGVHPGAGRPGQGGGLHATGRCRAAAVAVVVPGAGPAGRHRAGSARRSRRRRCAGGCPRTRSNPGSTSRGSSSPTPTSPPRPQRVLDLYDRIWDGKPLGAQRLRDLRRREDLHPGPLPLPPHPAAGQGPDDAGQPRLPPPRRGGLPGRLRRAPRRRSSAAARTPPASPRSADWSSRS